MYNANRCGDNTPPCLIPQVNLNERDNTDPHLTQDTQLYLQFQGTTCA